MEIHFASLFKNKNEKITCIINSLYYMIDNICIKYNYVQKCFIKSRVNVQYILNYFNLMNTDRNIYTFGML